MTDRSARLHKSDSSGSPGKGEPEFLVVGKLRRPHGVYGEILMEILTDFPERFQAETEVYAGNEYQPLRIRSIRKHRRALLVAFDGYDDRDSVGQLRNQFVHVRTDDRPPLPEGEYYFHELTGLQVVTDDGENLGVLTSILETGANDVYIVKPSDEGKDILLPAIDPVILKIDLEQGQILVHILPGLIPKVK
jgi:16S rRNA processing protein RimM